MGSDTEVSVIVTTFNRPRHLYKCLAAIAAQTVEVPVEVCVVNDGGAPVADVMGKAARDFPRLRIVWRDLDTNAGQVVARRTAVELASGAYLAFCDDDDRWLPLHLSALLAALGGGESELAYTDTELVWADVGPQGTRVQRRAPFAWRDAHAMLRAYNPVVPSSILMTRNLYQAIGGLDPWTGHYWDWDLLLSAARFTRFTRVPVCHTLYLIDAQGGNQSTRPEDMRPYLERLIEKHQLGNLPSSNFARMLEDPALFGWQAPTQTVWDGDPGIW